MSEIYLFSSVVPKLKAVQEPKGYGPLQIERSQMPTVDSRSIQGFLKAKAQSLDSHMQKQIADFFNELGVQIVANGKEKPALSEITETEAKSSYVLFKQIVDGKTPLKFRGSIPFTRECMTLIKKLFARPSGRYLLHTICGNQAPIFISLGEKNYVKKNDSRVEVFLKFDDLPLEIQIDENGKKQYGAFPPLAIFAHELIHAIQKQKMIQLIAQRKKGKHSDDLAQECNAAYKFHFYPSRNPHYTNLSELFTIAGIEGENYISEQMIRYEFGYPQRYGHLIAPFPPINPKDPNDNPNAKLNDTGRSRIYEIAYLGMEDEVQKLLSLGVDVQEALLGAAKGGNLELLQKLIQNHGANIHASSKLSSSQATAAHQAAFSGQLKVLQYLDEVGSPITLSDTFGYTPIHLACKSKQSEVIEYLVKRRVPLNRLTAKNQKSPLDLLIFDGGSKKSLKLMIDAGAQMTEKFYRSFSQKVDKLDPKLKERFKFAAAYYFDKKEACLIAQEKRTA